MQSLISWSNFGQRFCLFNFFTLLTLVLKEDMQNIFPSDQCLISSGAKCHKLCTNWSRLSFSTGVDCLFTYIIRSCFAAFFFLQRGVNLGLNMWLNTMLVFAAGFISLQYWLRSVSELSLPPCVCVAVLFSKKLSCVSDTYRRWGLTNGRAALVCTSRLYCREQAVIAHTSQDKHLVTLLISTSSNRERE